MLASDPGGRGSRGGRQTLPNRLGKGHLRGLTAESKAHLSWPRNQSVQAVFGLGEVAAVGEGLEDPVDCGFRDVGSLIDFFERFGLVLRLQQLEDIQGLGKHRNEIEAGRAIPLPAVSHMN